MAKRKVKPNFENGAEGLVAEVSVHRSRMAAFKGAVHELRPRFPGLKAVLTNDPMEGKSPLDFLPDPPPEHVTYTVSSPYPTYRVGPYELRAVLTTDSVGKMSLWTPEDGAMDRETVEKADFLRCDHCGNRRNRKKLFFFRKDGETALTQVGSTCCKDFFGVDVERELNKFWMDLGDALGDEDGWDNPQSLGGGRVNGHQFEWVMPVATVYVERHGYVSRRKTEGPGFGMATADQLSLVLFPPKFGNEPKEAREFREELVGEAREREEALMEELNAYREEKRAAHEAKWSEFSFNLVQNFEYTTLGFAAFIASDVVKRRAESNAPKAPKSKRLDMPEGGKHGPLGTFEVTFQREEESQWGVAYFHVAKAEDGTTVMFRRGKGDLKVGEKVELRGKVKKHLKDATVVSNPRVKVFRADGADTCPACGAKSKKYRFLEFRCGKCKTYHDRYTFEDREDGTETCADCGLNLPVRETVENGGKRRCYPCNDTMLATLREKAAT